MKQLILGAILGACALPAAAQNVPPKVEPGEMLLQVEADGEYRTRPDMMTIEAGVVSSGPTATRALAANSALAEKLLGAVRTQGVEPRDVQTSELSVSPVMDDDRAERENREPRIIGYTARNTIELRLRDLGRAPDIINALFEGGANKVTGPTFSLSDPKPAQRQARAAAVSQAREEAEVYAKAFGMRIARVIRASERGNFEYDVGNSIVVTGSRIPRSNVEPGELTTRVNLWVDYALLPL